MQEHRILLVDDEPTILDLYSLQLGDKLTLDTAASPEEAIRLFGTGNRHAVVVSDMHMPGMSGAELLEVFRQKNSAVVRIMLTSDSQQDVAVSAVNQGQIFRFLPKPCSAAELEEALHAALEHYRVVSAERELLDNTLRSSVGLLIDMLSVMKPVAFGRASRVKRVVESLAKQLDIENDWELKLAAMLSQLGCVSLTDELLQCVHEGRKLSDEQRQAFHRHPELGAKLLSKIPRLERISQLIAVQLLSPDLQAQILADTQLAFDASVLSISLEYDRLLLSGADPALAISELRQHSELHSQRIVDALESTVSNASQIRRVRVDGLSVGMLLESDIVDDTGTVLVTRGQAVSEVLLERLLLRSDSISSAISVSDPSASPQEEAVPLSS